MLWKRVLQGYVWECRGNGAIDPQKFGDEMWDLKTTGIFLIFLLGPRSGFIQMIPCDVTACRGDFKRTVLGSQRIGNSSVLINFQRVDRLGSPLEYERLLNLSLKFYPQCELVS
ncbi:hypothetical protein AVEN_189114-1 [Araneus ventricosus]|uniref:Uncharacterized protein n=1 Tax=Araneus ventricosus TaxID=182803 RepID=A0A4Y2PX96_ARAVE|nr:hypothetical protein AVEN_189114-1 [Araneus ventricosus]